jgi:hypothetical protein
VSGVFWQGNEVETGTLLGRSVATAVTADAQQIRHVLAGFFVSTNVLHLRPDDLSST